MSLIAGGFVPVSAAAREQAIAEGLLLAVCQRLGANPEEVRTSRARQPKRLVRARHEWWTSLWASGFPYAAIGRLSGYDHTTVMYAVRKELA